jgi:hypothetical protein
MKFQMLQTNACSIDSKHSTSGFENEGKSQSIWKGFCEDVDLESFGGWSSGALAALRFVTTRI